MSTNSSTNTHEIGWVALIALSAAFKASDGTGEAAEGFKRLLAIAADPLDPPDAAKARAILEDYHGVTVTLPACETEGDPGPGPEGDEYAAAEQARRCWEIAGMLTENVVAVDFRGDGFASGWTPAGPGRAA